jgi:hypothetical protein
LVAGREYDYLPITFGCNALRIFKKPLKPGESIQLLTKMN